MAMPRSRPRGRENARPPAGGAAAEHATKIYGVAAGSVIVTIAFLALTSTGRVIDAATQHFMLYYAGVFALIALCASVTLGLIATDRMVLQPAHRIFVQSAHRAASFGAVAFLLIHIVTEILAQRVHLLDSVVPFLSPFRTFYIGLGTISSDLILLIVVTGILRKRFTGHGKAWRWRAIHYTSYAAFVFGVWHGLLGGRPGKPYVDWSYGFVVAFVALGLAVRILANSLRPNETVSGPPVTESASSASAPMRAASMFAQLGIVRAARSAAVMARSAPQPMLSSQAGGWGAGQAEGMAPVLAALPAAGEEYQSAPYAFADGGQPYYEPGYVGPPRYMGAPRRADSGPMPRAATGPFPQQGGPAQVRDSGPMPRATTGPFPRAGNGPAQGRAGTASGPMPRAATDPFPRVASGPAQVRDSGPMPRATTGPFPRVGNGPAQVWGSGPDPGATSGPMPRAASRPMPRAATGPMPAAGPVAGAGPAAAGGGSGRHRSTGPAPQAGQSMPRSPGGSARPSATGPMPQGAGGPMPRAATGPMPRVTGGPASRAGSGPMPRGRTGQVPRAGSATPPGGRGLLRGGTPAGGTPAGGTRAGGGQRGASQAGRGWPGGRSARGQAQPAGPGWAAGSAAWAGAPNPASSPQPGRSADWAGSQGPAEPGWESQDWAAPQGPAGAPGLAGGEDWAGPRDWTRATVWTDVTGGGAWSPGQPPWEGAGASVPDPAFTYREPGPGMPGYRGASDRFRGR